MIVIIDLHLYLLNFIPHSMITGRISIGLIRHFELYHLLTMEIIQVGME
jgi:hypothetical protein